MRAALAVFVVALLAAACGGDEAPEAVERGPMPPQLSISAFAMR